MGTNLRAKSRPRSDAERNKEADAGKPAWRPSNGKLTGLWDSFTWDGFTPARRQRLLDPDTLEVDDSGPVHVVHGPQRGHIDAQEATAARQRWWGEVHGDSYGALLCALQTRLNRTFYRDWHDNRRIHDHWQDVMTCDPSRWGVREIEPLSEADLEKHAKHHFPVYACGYNWLECCEKSSRRLEQRIVQIIESWQGLKRKCDQVILVTHSMGGLVARACAKRIPDKIAGVIHGVMPALGAPAAYRRMTCGTEAPESIRSVPDFVKWRVAAVLGASTYRTTPVLATSPGALELLPNHRYPGPWLHIRVMERGGSSGETALDYLHFPGGKISSPYELYRDITSWYRMVDPVLADPAGKFRNSDGGVVKAVRKAIDAAEWFHTKYLDAYYHPNTYAFYGDDPDQRSFGQVRWVGRREESVIRTAFTRANIAGAALSVNYDGGARLVTVEHESQVLFKPEPQDTRGDGTVPHQSGAGPAGAVKQVFGTRGYDHQGSYNNDAMAMLTLRLIAQIAKGVG
jgi:pimeloyl-ACP methyl ester carboxylesterase